MTASSMNLVTRKPVFGVCDHVRLKPACAATETSKRLEISAIASRGTILSRQRTTKALFRLRLFFFFFFFFFRIGQKQVFSWRGSYRTGQAVSQEERSFRADKSFYVMFLYVFIWPCLPHLQRHTWIATVQNQNQNDIIESDIIETSLTTTVFPTSLPNDNCNSNTYRNKITRWKS